MTNEDQEKATAAVEAAVQEVKQVEAGQQPVSAFRVPGVDLGPAFNAIIDCLKPIRERLLLSINSSTDRNFQQQRDDLLELQSLTRAFDVLAGYVTPDGRELEPLQEKDPEAQAQRDQSVREAVERTTGQMRQRSAVYSDVPLEPTRNLPRALRRPPEIDYATGGPISEFAPKRKGWLRG